jgi:hypothetical protein
MKQLIEQLHEVLIFLQEVEQLGRNKQKYNEIIQMQTIISDMQLILVEMVIL